MNLKNHLFFVFEKKNKIQLKLDNYCTKKIEKIHRNLQNLEQLNFQVFGIEICFDFFLIFLSIPSVFSKNLQIFRK